MEKRFLTEREVNAAFGLGIKLLRRMRARDAGPPFVRVSGQLGQKGGRLLYEAAAVSRWIASRTPWWRTRGGPMSAHTKHKIRPNSVKARGEERERKIIFP